jgi:tRNA A-37 threonylcarbamoyl transferase component Bud32
MIIWIVGEQMNPAGNSLGIAIGHIALRRGMITPEQLREALIEQSRSDRSLETVLIAKGFLSREQVGQLHQVRETTTLPLESSAKQTPSPTEIPARIGRYSVLRVAGNGAMARVFEAMDPELQRKVALKVLHPSANVNRDEAQIEEERYQREARLLAGLPKHPNIVGIYEAGVADGRRFLAMEYIDGVPMDQWQKKGSVTLGRPTTILRDVALAVHHAHRNGVIHRDLKPANILVDGEGRPHVTDFGLAKLVGQSVRASYTEGALAVGTPAYMSPEQAAGSKAVDARTDVYSMGVMLYEILTGRLPFVGASPMEVMIKTSKDPVVPPSKITGIQINPVHFKTLEGICLKALAKSPDDRHATAEQFAEDLSKWLRGRDFRVRSERFRKRLIAGVVAAVVLVSGGLATYKLRYSVNAELSKADALLQEGRAAEALALYAAAAERDALNPRAREGRQRALDTLTPKPPPAPADPWKQAIDLLKLVDLSHDVVSGTWNRDGSAVIANDGRPARIMIPYHPPEEYDLRLTFARRPANFCLDLILTHAGKAFTLVAHRDGFFGFERIDGKDFSKNSTTRRFDTPLQMGQSYTVLVQVRKDGVKSFCDGKPLSALESYGGVIMNPDWKLPDSAAVGVGTWDGGAALERLDVLEVGGVGGFLRPPGPSRKY